MANLRNSIKKIKENSLKFGYIFCDNKYVNNRTKHRFLCLKHNEVCLARYGNISRGKRTICCRKNQIKTRRTLKIENVKKYASNFGFEFIENRWRGCNEYYRFKCIKHNKIYKHKWSVFTQSKRLYCCWCESLSKRKLPTGKKHHNWKFNLTDKDRENRKRRYNFYVKWAKSVKIKYNNACQICFRKNKKIHAHHLNSYSSNKKERINLNNGIVLCEKHHILFHQLWGYGNNTKKQFDNFQKQYATQ